MINGDTQRNSQTQRESKRQKHSLTHQTHLSRQGGIEGGIYVLFCMRDTAQVTLLAAYVSHEGAGIV